ncbi:MAG: winged helix-turn-helix domain-containing protein [Candidatus Acidiferrales bacterium]
MPPAVKAFQFGPFELRTETRELFKRGIRLKLRPQAYQVLLLLVECAGEVVSREQLRERLWSQETYVDFEHGLNTAVKELRAVLSDSVAEPKFIQTLPRIGYRLLVPVNSGQPLAYAEPEQDLDAALAEPNGREAAMAPLAEASAQKTAPPTAALAAPNGSGWLRKSWWIPAAVAVLVAVTFLLGWHNPWRKSSSVALPDARRMLAVLPFENLTGDPAQEYFSDGLTEEMIAQLGRLDPAHLGVIGRNSVMRYKTSHEDTAAIGRELGVSYLLEGSVRREADKVRITAELIQVQDRSNIWSRQYDRELTDILALQSEIAQEIAGEIHLTLDANASNETRARLTTPESQQAYDLYLRGLYFWNKRTTTDIQRATDCFQQAVQKDPSSARAYAALADAETLVTGYAGTPPDGLIQKARAAAQRAVELDDNLAEAHVSRAVVAQDFNWDWKTAESEYRRAIELNPNYATAHHWYGEYLALMGRFAEARVEMQRAQQLDPLSLIIASDNAVIFYYARQYDAAIQQFREVLEMEPDFPRAAPVAFAYLEKGMNSDADALLERGKKMGADNPWYWGNGAYVSGRIGKTEEARSDLQGLIRLSQREQVDPIVFATAYIGLRENDMAIGWLQKSHAAHSVSLTGLKVDPTYDPLRGDPRFQEVLREMNFPQ